MIRLASADGNILNTEQRHPTDDVNMPIYHASASLPLLSKRLIFLQYNQNNIYSFVAKNIFIWQSIFVSFVFEYHIQDRKEIAFPHVFQRDLF